jgi:hypothetical protein
MKKEELRKMLLEKKVPDLDTIEEIDQKICLEYDGKDWIVYYSERGKRFNLVKYHTGDEACDDIFNRLMA